MVKVYFSNYRRKLSDSVFSEYLRLLPPVLEEKIIRFKRWEDQHASLYGKLLLMKALKESGFHSDLLHIKYTKYGRPYLENTFDFNISHSGYFAVCALSRKGKIGIDIEEIKPIAVTEFKEEFSEEEWHNITNSSDSDYWFYYYWTAKEAAIKADGGGLQLPLKEINISNDKIKINKTKWVIKNITIAENYLLQIATDHTTNSEINLVEVSF